MNFTTNSQLDATACISSESYSRKVILCFSKACHKQYSDINQKLDIFLIATFQNIEQLLTMPAGPDIPICLALSPHPKLKSFTNKTKGRTGGEIPFLLMFSLWQETDPPKKKPMIIIKPLISQLSQSKLLHSDLQFPA